MKRKHKRVTRNISLIASVETELLSELTFPTCRDSYSSNDRDSIAIIGGELFNKGAQAMTFTVVDQLSERFPEKDIYLLSRRDYERPPEEKSQYTFDILPWGLEVYLALFSSTLDYLNTTDYSRRIIDDVRELLLDCSFIIDINGYALSSQQGFDLSFEYINNIVLARKFDIPMYIFPQSIGPFDYSQSQKLLLNPLLRTYLTYPELICPRESEGIKSLTPYTRNNVQHEFDIVLQNQDYNLKNIFTTAPDLKQKDIRSDAVGIVPNSKVFERADPEELYLLYDAVIEMLLKENQTIYLLRHSVEDLDLCENIKKRFSDEDHVVLIGEELNAIELEYIIDQFDFMIGSRYHSLIHAYKNATPVLAIGWATKYQELLSEFEQSQYFFEGRNEVNTEDFLKSVSEMVNNYERESISIGKKRNKITNDDLFDDIIHS
ncbi:polysaccharide pyruvyl transferase family protein [Halalkalicoccus tibetensis]|uniref:Polysaccharide pyruvyl transferase family protein n=1 Tax=Halalkalicoccus tibetensis TaxID=175632 RepID=A0ABD5V2P4_9EURY